MISALTSFWSTDRALSLLLVFLCCVIFVVIPLGELRVFGRIVVSASFSLLLISGVMAVRRKSVTVVLVGGMVVASLAVRWTKLALGVPTMEAVDAVLAIGACGALAAVVMAQVFREGPITNQRLQGAVAVYLLIGLMWAFAYSLVDLLHAGAFAPATGPRDFAHFVYFSFVALTTVGFGDITPLHPLARSLVTIEALIGQLFPAILLARLVTLATMHETSVLQEAISDGDRDPES